MKIKEKRITQADFTNLLKSLKEEYKTIFIYQFGEQVFIYRPIGRKEYKDLILNPQLTDQEKEERECSICTLWPENYDFSNCEEAGLPTELSKAIEENSYLSEERRQLVLSQHRADMFDLDNQINCLIMAAFPNLSLEEVENWDVMTACKYLSRAEWILAHVNGLKFTQKDPLSSYVKKGSEEITDTPPINETAPAPKPQPKTDTSMSTKKHKGPPVPESFGGPIKPKEKAMDIPVPQDMLKSISGEKDVAHNGKPKVRQQPQKQKLTPEKLAELKAKYPEIDWENDAGNDGFADFTAAAQHADETPYALRVKGKAVHHEKPNYIYYTPDLENKPKEKK